MSGEVTDYVHENGLPEQTGRELLSFLDDLEESGQEVEDWNFNMSERIADENASEEEDRMAKVQRMFQALMKQRENVEKYYG